MNLFDIDKEPEYRKTVRILVYPNITFQKDLEKDSYIQVIKNQITLLNTIRDDLWFYLILPEPVPSLVFDNVTQYYMDFPTYPPTMRSHFDVPKFKEIVSSGLDFDLVMSHLPEHTHAIKNVMYNVTHHAPLFFGYCHWFDLNEVVAWSKDSFLQNITGLLEYAKCYLNTEHQKKMVLKQAERYFNTEMISVLDHILEVQHLGVNEEDIVSEVNKKNYSDKIIVFNHRPDTYKNFKGFMKTVDDLWEMRQDFTVWIPLLEKPNREFVTTEKGDKQWYYNKLKSCYVGLAPRQNYGGWSVAATDGMMNGVPYVMYNDTYYQELWPRADFFENDGDATLLLNTYLDDPKYRNEQAREALSRVSSDLVYMDKIKDMSDYIDQLLGYSRPMSDTVILKDIIGWIKEEKSISKKEIMSRLGWGRGIRWTPYRRALLKNPNIYDVMNQQPMYCWRDR